MTELEHPPFWPSVVFILQVRIFIAPQKVAAFFDALRPAYECAVAEPECRFFFIGQDTEEPGCVILTEGWARDVDWFWDVQQKKEYYRSYLEQTRPMYIKPREIRTFNPIATMIKMEEPDDSDDDTDIDIRQPISLAEET